MKPKIFLPPVRFPSDSGNFSRPRPRDTREILVCFVSVLHSLGAEAKLKLLARSELVALWPRSRFMNVRPTIPPQTWLGNSSSTTSLLEELTAHSQVDVTPTFELVVIASFHHLSLDREVFAQDATPDRKRRAMTGPLRNPARFVSTKKVVDLLSY
jgi:hypothetical protein